MKKCKYCGKEFSHKGHRCHTCISRIRRYKNKKRAVEHLGGSCVKCGYSEHLAALEFHHINKDKDHTIGNIMNRRWDFIKKELDKCILLCSNCHRVEHNKYMDTIYLIESA